MARVAQRVSEGGHDVSATVIRRRFHAGRCNFENVYRGLVNEWAEYDNSESIPKAGGGGQTGVSSHHRIPARAPRDPDMVGAEAAMHRAARRARGRAEAVAKAADAPDQSARVRLGAREVETRSDPRTLTFSQAQGYEAIPELLVLGELPSDARAGIWNQFYRFLTKSLRCEGQDVSQRWELILLSKREHDRLPLDEWSPKFSAVRTELRSSIETLPFNKVFDLIQFVLGHPACPSGFVAAIKRVFSECRLAYTIDEGKPPTIIPAVTPEEGHTVVDALQTLRGAGLSGAASHLRNASERVNASDWAGSVRESIHAVESVARTLDSTKPRNLKGALASLEKRAELHPALKEAFKKLYGYTSDEQGIRHALLDGPTADVGRDEAVFMLGACASFASYLWRKHTAGSGA